MLEQLRTLNRDLDESVWFSEMEGDSTPAILVKLDTLWTIFRYTVSEKVLCRRSHDFKEIDWNSNGYVCVECQRCGRTISGYH